VNGLAAIVLDCRRAAPLARFWAAALDWEVRPYDDAEIARLAGRGHTPETDPTVAVDAPDGSLVLFCVEVPEPKTAKNRMHLDVRLRDEAHFEELLSMGARIIERRDDLVVMADPEGHEFCVIDPPSAA